MTTKRHVALIISTEPIDLTGMALDGSIEHFIQVETNLTPDGRGGFNIDQAVPELCISDAGTKFHGNGRSVSVAIVDWLKQLVSSIEYWPFYRNRQGLDRKRGDR